MTRRGPRTWPAVESELRTVVWRGTHTGFFYNHRRHHTGDSEARPQQAPLRLIACLGSITSESCDQPRQRIKKQTHHVADQGPSSQGYGFSSGHVRM